VLRSDCVGAVQDEVISLGGPGKVVEIGVELFSLCLQCIVYSSLLTYPIFDTVINQGAPKFQPNHLLARKDFQNIRQNVQKSKIMSINNNQNWLFNINPRIIF
jgi:hypothetical protein